MSEMDNIDILLNRPLKSGKDFDKYFAKSGCEKTFIGKGYTDFSIRKIKEAITKFSPQTKKIAPKLKGANLQTTTRNIKDFLYHYIQYRKDEAAQLLRSPNCSWSDRKEGIDCKSYAIFSGCILRSMKINFFIRKIKQPDYFPSYFTHVYIIVPADQTIKRLSKDDLYYVIDPTISSSVEPVFVDFKNAYMSTGEGLSHYSLNAPSAIPLPENIFDVTRIVDDGAPLFQNSVQQSFIDRQPVTRNTNASNDDFSNFLRELLNSFIDGISGNILCIVAINSTFPPKEVLQHIEKAHAPYLTYLNNEVSRAATVADFNIAINKLIEAVYVIEQFFLLKVGEKNWNKCSLEGLSVFNKFFAPIRVQLDRFLKEIEDGFAHSKSSRIQLLTHVIPAGVTNFGRDYVMGQNPKGSVELPVLAFSELPTGDPDIGQGSGGDTTGGGSTGGGTGTGSGSGTGTGTNLPPDSGGSNTTTFASSGLILGLATLGLLFSNFGKKSSPRRATTKRRRRR